MRHAISLGARNYNWPSIQEASAMLFWRIYEAQVCAEGGTSSPSCPSAQVSQAA